MDHKPARTTASWRQGVSPWENTRFSSTPMPEIAHSRPGSPADVSAATPFVGFPESPYRLHELFPPAGDQPEAIEKLVAGVRDRLGYQTPLAGTRSGKAY